LADSNPDSTNYQRDLSISYDRIGDVLVAAGHREEALAAYQKALAIGDKLAAADPGNAGWQTDLVVSYYKIASVSETKEPNLAKALEILRRLDAVGAFNLNSAVGLGSPAGFCGSSQPSREFRPEQGAAAGRVDGPSDSA